MRIRIPLLAFLFISFFSCTEAEEPIIEDPVVDDPIAEDEKNPELTVTGFSEIIETNTDISISIVDESTVETKVIHNDEEIATSIEKQFDLSINPYILPVGSTDFTVVSIDAKGNETEETYSAEIKHLLMTYEVSNQEHENSTQSFWVFFNSLDGKELAVIKPAPGTPKIYTDEIVLENNILYSFVRYNEFTYGSGSDKQLHLTTYKIPLGGTRPQVTWEVNESPQNVVEVTLKGIPFENGRPNYLAGGVTGFDGNDQQTVLTIKHDAVKPIYIRPSHYGSSLFDGKKENYRFIKLTPQAGNTSLDVELNELVPAEDNFKIDIPAHKAGTLFLTRYGYENFENVSVNESYSIYAVAPADAVEFPSHLDLPKFSSMNHYVNSLSYAIDDWTYYSAQGADNNLDANMPNWMTEVQLTDTEIEVIANNPEVDYYSVTLDKRSFENSEGRVLNWSYSVFGEEGNATVMRLELPSLISETVGDSFFQTTDGLELERLIVNDYDKFETYDEIIDWLIFKKNEPSYLDNDYRRISTRYPTSFFSNKSKVDSKSWNLDAFRSHNLEESGQVRKR